MVLFGLRGYWYKGYPLLKYLLKYYKRWGAVLIELKLFWLGGGGSGMVKAHLICVGTNSQDSTQLGKATQLSSVLTTLQ